MKKIPENIREVSDKLRSLTSLIQTEYNELLSIFSVPCEEKLSLYTLKGKPRRICRFKERSDSSLYGSVAKLDFLLTYLKHNPLQDYQGLLFEMSPSKVSEWLVFLLPVLEKSLSQRGFLAQEGFVYQAQKDTDSSYFSADVTEREIARNLDYQAQKEEYSGKYKKHTVKNLLLCNEDKEIVFLSELYEGSIHDKTILDDLEMNTQGRNILLDLGFQGTTITEAILPFKKPKNQDLSPLKKTINKALARIRVGIENAFAGVKILHIVADKIRLKSNQVRQ